MDFLRAHRKYEKSIECGAQMSTFVELNINRIYLENRGFSTVLSYSINAQYRRKLYVRCSRRLINRYTDVRFCFSALVVGTLRPIGKLSRETVQSFDRASIKPLSQPDRFIVST